MPPRCTVCSHPERPAIDKAIVGGATCRDIARRFKVSKDAANRHESHVTKLLAKTEARQARTLASLVARGHEVVETVLEDADPELRLKAVDRLAKLAELEFGTKAKVETTQRPAPADTVEELHELRRDVDAAIAEKEKGLQ